MMGATGFGVKLLERAEQARRLEERVEQIIADLGKLRIVLADEGSALEAELEDHRRRLEQLERPIHRRARTAARAAGARARGVIARAMKLLGERIGGN
jgi:regulator of replication initiation timing